MNWIWNPLIVDYLPLLLVAWLLAVWMFGRDVAESIQAAGSYDDDVAIV